MLEHIEYRLYRCWIILNLDYLCNKSRSQDYLTLSLILVSLTLSPAKTQDSISLAKTQGYIHVRLNQRFIHYYFINTGK